MIASRHGLIRLCALAAALVAIGIALCGCNAKALFDRVVSPEYSATSRHFIDLLAAGDVAAIYAKLDRSLITGQSRAQLERMSMLLGRTPPDHVDVIGAKIFVNPPNTDRNYTFQFHYQHPARWLIANAAYRESKGTISIIGMQVIPIPDAFDHLNRFTFEGKGASQFLGFIAAIAIPMFVIWTIVVAARTPMKKRRWLWIIFIILAFTHLQINWTTGRMAFQLLSFQLFGAGIAAASPYSPWILGISFPLGAIVFWLRRPYMLRNAAIGQ